MVRLGSSIAVAFVLFACGAPAGETAESTAPHPGHFKNFDGEGEVKIVWSIPEEAQPPLLDGARDVLTSVALAEFGTRVGRFLSSSPAVYEGKVVTDAAGEAEVMVTWNTRPSLTFSGVSFDQGAHELNLYAGSADRWAVIWQDRAWEALAMEARPQSGLGSAWLDVETATGDRLHGRCVACMTILEEEPVDAIIVSTTGIDLEDAGVVSFQLEAELSRVAPEAFTPTVLGRLWRAMGDGAGEAAVGEFVEVAPDVWEREHTDRTYLRCKEGGSRLVDYRTTWRLHHGVPSRSGIGDIEVFDAAACEAFDYGGGS